MKAERIKWWADYFTSYGHEGILPEQVEALVKEAQAEQRERDAGKVTATIHDLHGPEGDWAEKILNSAAKAIRDDTG